MEYPEVRTSDVLSETKSSRLQWHDSSTREIWAKEKYETTDGAVSMSKAMPSVPYAPREAYPLVEYILVSSSEGLIERGNSSELKELCKLAARQSLEQHPAQTS
jgi:hypothetical protein